MGKINLEVKSSGKWIVLTLQEFVIDKHFSNLLGAVFAGGHQDGKERRKGIGRCPG